MRRLITSFIFVKGLEMPLDLIDSIKFYLKSFMMNTKQAADPIKKLITAKLIDL